MIRELTTEDLTQVVEVSKVRIPEDEQISPQTLNYFLMQDQFKIFGFFEDDLLITVVIIKFGELHGEKTWTVIHMFTRRLRGIFSFGDDFGQIIAKVFEIAEEKGFYNYVYMVNKKHENAYYRMWKTNKFLPPSNRYTISNLAEIPAGTIAPENWMVRLMGGPKNYDCVIKMRKLKEEFRNDSINAS